MASNKKAPWSANVTYWTPNHSCKVSGSMAGAMRLMFMAMPADMRGKVLDGLNAAHQQLKEKEAESAEPAAE